MAITSEQQGQIGMLPTTGSPYGDIATTLLNYGTQFLNADKTKRLAEFNAEQQAKMVEEVKKAQTVAEKQKILQDALDKRERGKRIPYYIAGGIALVGISIAVYYFVIKKK